MDTTAGPMNAAIFIRDMKSVRSNQASAFTLIELLIVIAIIAVVAGLVVGLNTVASEKKKISRAQVERDRLVTLIEAYKLKLGVYPPADTNNPANNTLAYELAGAVRDFSDPGNPIYRTPFGSFRSNELYAEFGVRGLINASDDPTEVKRFLKDLKPDQYVERGPARLRRLTIPINDVDGNQTNFWKYLAGTDEDTKRQMRNQDAFDLWVTMKVRDQLRTNGNWKD